MPEKCTYNLGEETPISFYDPDKLPLLPSLGYMKQKENPRYSLPFWPSCSLKPEMVSLFSPSFKIFLCLFILHLKILVVLSGRNREKCIYSIFSRNISPMQIEWKDKQSLRDTWDYNQRSNFCVIGVPEEKDKTLLPTLGK